ncbi:MAG: extracellular solute-binding protein, partial [Parcubacteria group bacterium]|nr:extracellular solute-binding protein [Parcubacteria group bacterium]
MKYRIIIFALAGLLVLISVLAFVFGRRGGGGEAATLEFWGTQETANWSAVILAYQTANPNIKIKYTQKDSLKYEKELVDALASGLGPDVAVINNTWLNKHLNKFSPAPGSLVSPQIFKDSFMDVTYEELVRSNKVYALPFYVDTLALYYNKALYNNAGLVSPPKTWDDFNKSVESLSQKNSNGDIIRSGAALGTAANVNYASDILNLLMLQTGATMLNPNAKQAAFDRAVVLDGRNYSPGLAALDFYTSFANSSKPVYAWNSRMPNSLKAFTAGKTAMYLGYAQDLKEIKKAVANFGVSPMPQIKDSRRDAAYLDINYAAYQAGAVTGTSLHKEAAWDFLIFATGRASAAGYLQSTYLPPARRDLVDFTATDPILNIFAKQALTAANWSQPDEVEVKKIFE